MRIVLRDVCVSYDEGLPSPTPALSGVDLAFGEASCAAVIGPTGSGKTTLLEVAAGLTAPSSGSATLEGAPSGARLRDAVGLAYQFPESQFFEESVFGDVAFGPEKQGLSEEEVRRRVTDALRRVGLPADRFGERSPLSLSAGEKRRAAIAGILALDRPFLLLDEPTAGLDPMTAERVAAIVRSETEGGRGVVVVTHDLELVDAVASRVVVLGDGAVLEDGPTAGVFASDDLLDRLGLERPARHELVGRLRRAEHPEADSVARVLLGGGPAGPLAAPGSR